MVLFILYLSLRLKTRRGVVKQKIKALNVVMIASQMVSCNSVKFSYSSFEHDDYIIAYFNTGEYEKVVYLIANKKIF